MIRLLVFILFVSSVMIAFIPNDAFGCSMSLPPLRVFSPFTNHYTNCSVTNVSLSVLGLMLIMLIVSAVIIIIKHWFKFSRKFYIIIIPAVFLCLLAYSVVYYGTLDLADFLIAHRIIGDTNSTHYARQLASDDFKNMLEKYYVEYREENFYVIFDTNKLTRQQYQNHDYPLPYEYCGIAIADDHTEYWYTATYDNKKLTESQFHLERPHDPDATNSKTCIHQVTNQKRDQFKFRP